MSSCIMCVFVCLVAWLLGELKEVAAFELRQLKFMEVAAGELGELGPEQ